MFAQLTGYHWDCSDWALIEDHPKPQLQTAMLEVSVVEVRDSESNSDNSAIELVVTNEQAQAIKRPVNQRRKALQQAAAASPTTTNSTTNPTIITTTTNCNGASSASSTNGHSRLPVNGGNHSYSLVPPSRKAVHHETEEEDESGPSASASLLAIDEQIQEFEYADDSLPSSPIKYISHPNEYLPVYRSNGDVNGSEDGMSSNWTSSDGDIMHPRSNKHLEVITDSSNDNLSNVVIHHDGIHKAKPANVEDTGYDGDHHDLSDSDSIVSGRLQSTFV